MPKRFNAEEESIETLLKAVMLSENFIKTKAQYNRMLGILGNVDGDEVIGLVVLAMLTSEAK